ncbi:hypothetical protein [Jannaschia sp. LMIT008]|uniref:hypothetical protein n=1 Tax=Jannaschia maritima TaxID=3032585 RepID=UPI0028116124|nr:hypothetical protein [Jannaschia sp. LMIT008]
MHLAPIIDRYLREQSGTVQVDWTVLTFGATVTALATAAVLVNATGSISDVMRAEITGERTVVDDTQTTADGDPIADADPIDDDDDHTCGGRKISAVVIATGKRVCVGVGVKNNRGNGRDIGLPID